MPVGCYPPCHTPRIDGQNSIYWDVLAGCLRSVGRVVAVVGLGLIVATVCAGNAVAQGEPAEDFLKRLRAVGYFDTAILYLDRLNQYPGVDPKLLEAISLEKAQTYIDSAVVARTETARDESFVDAEKQLTEFLKLPSHPRLSEARLQLGRLQMVRAAQLMSGKVDDAKRASARESYLAAAKTFDAIVESLREKLKEMQGQKIDAVKEPEKAALRDSYRGEYLQGQLNSGESRRLAAKTYNDPANEGKTLLEEALKSFSDLSDKYDTYVQGAISMLYRGQVLQDLGKREEALDSYVRMLEQPEADPLRDAKFQAVTGLIQLYLTDKPPKFNQAIERGQPMLDSARPDEKRSQAIQQLRVELAKAYIARVADKDNQKAPDVKRAETESRQLLIAASKVPGLHVDEAQSLLSGMGISKDDAIELPTAADPKNFEEGLNSGRDLYQASETIQASLTELEKQPNAPANEIEDLKKQVAETRSNAVSVLSRGLSMATTENEVESINQARFILSYLLYLEKRYHDATVVGSFLSKQSPGNDLGLRGGLIALTSLQLLIAEVGDSGDDLGLVNQLRDLGDYLSTTWPDDPQAAGAQGIMITLALSKDRFDDAKELLAKMPAGSKRATFERLMGRILWDKANQLRFKGKTEESQAALDESEKVLDEAREMLASGLGGIEGKLVEAEGLQAALALAKIYTRQDKYKEAIGTLDHPIYGPVTLIGKQDAPDENFKSDLYSTELRAVVGSMTSEGGDPEKLLERATGAMDKLRSSVPPEESQKRLTPIYLGMANDIRDQLDKATPDKKAKLIDAFRVFLARIAETTEDPDTLQWVGQTLVQMGESSMNPGETVAMGQAKDLIASAVATFESLKTKSKDLPLNVDFQLGRGYRLLGEYSKAISTLEQVLLKKPMMLDAQVEAATAYEMWAGATKPEFAGKAYKSALLGARPNANDPKKSNTIWGWGKISQLSSGKPQFAEIFFDARYHVARCRFLMGVANKNEAEMEKAIGDITQVSALYPELGGAEQRQKFDTLLKEIQKRLNRAPDGLPPAKQQLLPAQ
jgi:tetratricopeptide (TPR) repeat protein